MKDEVIRRDGRRVGDSEGENERLRERGARSGRWSGCLRRPPGIPLLEKARAADAVIVSAG